MSTIEKGPSSALPRFTHKSVQDAKVVVASHQDGVPIYAASSSAINWEVDHKAQAERVTREEVKGVPGAFLLHNVLTCRECEQFIQLSEKMGFQDALVTTSRGMVKSSDTRNNKRVIWQNERQFLNESVWKRIERSVPEVVEYGVDFERCGLNERVRFYRYTGGERFAAHYDGCYTRTSRNRSFLTFIIYLNDDEKRKGGETTFFMPPRKRKTTPIVERWGRKWKSISVKPRTGSALLFFHSHKLSPLHEGTALEAGCKYVLRSDVMYHVKEDKVKAKAKRTKSGQRQKQESV